jgi:hypothetical protein
MHQNPHSGWYPTRRSASKGGAVRRLSRPTANTRLAASRLFFPTIAPCTTRRRPFRTTARASRRQGPRVSAACLSLTVASTLSAFWRRRAAALVNEHCASATDAYSPACAMRSRMPASSAAAGSIKALLRVSATWVLARSAQGSAATHFCAKSSVRTSGVG